MERIVITVAREAGSGGMEITRALSESLNIPYYDRELLNRASDVVSIHNELPGMAAGRRGFREMMLAAKDVYSEGLLPRDSNDFISTAELFHFQAKVVRKLAEEDNCLILGRCGNYLVKDLPYVMRLFIHAPIEFRAERVAKQSSLWEQTRVMDYITREDQRRASYYYYYTHENWRDTAGYDLSLDSSRLGIDGCVQRVKDLLPYFVQNN